LITRRSLVDDWLLVDDLLLMTVFRSSIDRSSSTLRLASDAGVAVAAVGVVVLSIVLLLLWLVMVTLVKSKDKARLD
jgi:hypothetical protein